MIVATKGMRPAPDCGAVCSVTHTGSWLGPGGGHSVSLVPVVHREASGSLGGRVGPEAKEEKKEGERDHGWNRVFSHGITM